MFLIVFPRTAWAVETEQETCCAADWFYLYLLYNRLLWGFKVKMQGIRSSDPSFCNWTVAFQMKAD